MSGHTPAPWVLDLCMGVPIVRAGPVRRYVNGEGRDQLVSISTIALSEEEEAEALRDRRAADARLIAAAPELLALARLVVAETDDVGGELRHTPREALYLLRKAAKAAIAKAEGVKP